MNVFFKHGEIFDYTNTTGAVLPGNSVLVMNDLVGVVEADIQPGAQGSVVVAGVVVMPKNIGEVWTAGQKINWDPVANNFTIATTDGATPTVWAGWAYYPQLATDTVGYIKLKVG